MSCETVIGSIVALLDGELPGAERGRVEEHLAGCSACQGELRALQATRELVSRSLGAFGQARARSSFDDLWARIERDVPPPAESRSWSRLRRASASPRALRRRRVFWAGAGGLALAASLALLVVGLPPDQSTLPAPEAGRVASRAPQMAAAKTAKPVTRIAAAKPKPAPEPARAKSAPEADSALDQAAPEEMEAAVVANEIDPPRELLERPDLFLDYPLVRKLDELQHLESVLADTPDGGSAG